MYRISNHNMIEFQKLLKQFNINIVGSKLGHRYGFPRYFTDSKSADTVIDGRFYCDASDSPVYHDFSTERLYVVEVGERDLTQLSNMVEHWENRSGENGSRMAREILEREYQAKQLRNRYPAVQAAWEQYSLMLHLSSNGMKLDND